MVGTKQNKAQFSKKSKISTIKSEYFTRSTVVNSQHFQDFHLKDINYSIKDDQVFVNFFNATVTTGDIRENPPKGEK